jgi:hypothetical protein
MNQQQIDSIQQVVALLTKANIDRQAETDVLLEAISDLVSEETDGELSAEQVRSNLKARIKARKEAALLKFENLDPSFAAWMDVGNGPKPPPLQP